MGCDAQRKAVSPEWDVAQARGWYRWKANVHISTTCSQVSEETDIHILFPLKCRWQEWNVCMDAVSPRLYACQLVSGNEQHLKEAKETVISISVSDGYLAQNTCHAQLNFG